MRVTTMRRRLLIFLTAKTYPSLNWVVFLRPARQQITMQISALVCTRTTLLLARINNRQHRRLKTREKLKVRTNKHISNNRVKSFRTRNSPRTTAEKLTLKTFSLKFLMIHMNKIKHQLLRLTPVSLFNIPRKSLTSLFFPRKGQKVRKRLSEMCGRQ